MRQARPNGTGDVRSVVGNLVQQSVCEFDLRTLLESFAGREDACQLEATQAMVVVRSDQQNSRAAIRDETTPETTFEARPS